jgi:hypothetical protein
VCCWVLLGSLALFGCLSPTASLKSEKVSMVVPPLLLKLCTSPVGEGQSQSVQGWVLSVWWQGVDQTKIGHRVGWILPVVQRSELMMPWIAEIELPGCVSIFPEVSWVVAVTPRPPFLGGQGLGLGGVEGLGGEDAA